MAIRRTLQQKKEAEVRREVSYQWSGQSVATVTPSASKPTFENKNLVQQLSGYPVKYIYRDLLKTLLISVCMILALVALKFWKL